MKRKKDGRQKSPTPRRSESPRMPFSYKSKPTCANSLLSSSHLPEPEIFETTKTTSPPVLVWPGSRRIAESLKVVRLMDRSSLSLNSRGSFSCKLPPLGQRCVP
ncbi:hypothetical protein CgunFtcFv8_005856 [Champsocephalus gunnari]|uniref:Uncharacterized protein n=1 Tax=Champsocephalus gunnari TaxID=52237 RepID=A0AAN8HD59_CHAGU|nr:hypothetical protein CgunFtcFv8_005856 [Champsocephalus gunnari]